MKQPTQIDVEELKRQLLAQKSTKERFRIPWDYATTNSALTAAYMAEVEYRGRQYIADNDTKGHISHAASWLSDTYRKFGIVLCGLYGNGKTTLASAIKSLAVYVDSKYGNDTIKMRTVNAREICHLAKTDYKAFVELEKTTMLFIDDLGIEPAEVLDYGNVISPAIELLGVRYDLQLFTVVTTNLTPAQIREHYGDRIADRFNEMMNRIVFTNKSYRR